MTLLKIVPVLIYAKIIQVVTVFVMMAILVLPVIIVIVAKQTSGALTLAKLLVTNPLTVNLKMGHVDAILAKIS